MNETPRTTSGNGSPPKRVPTLKELLDLEEWDEFNGKIKVLKFRDGADVFVVPEGEVESVGSFSPDGAVLTLRSGQEVTVDRRAGVESVEVESVEEMVKLVVNKESKERKNGLQASNRFAVKSGGGGKVPEVPSKRRGI